MERGKEENIDALYYHWMYDSPACWKNDVRVVTNELKKLTSKSTKYAALKENIMIRVKGFNWEWCQHAWSKDGRKYSVKELANHLRWIIKEEKKHDKPTGPDINVPERTNLPILETQTCDVATLNEKYLADETEFKKKAARTHWERELKGEGSMYSQL